MRRFAELDYLCNFYPRRTLPRGLDAEVFRFSVLEAAWREAREPGFREHVTSFMYGHPERFRIAGVTYEPDWSVLRWTVDTPDDYALVRRIYEHFGHDRFGWEDVLAVLGEHPDWRELNQHVKQKAI